ncbi:hypothetical protein SEVIR_2G334751v4 [Setaria viridis]
MKWVKWYVDVVVSFLQYPRGVVHVQCFGCWTINLVLEEHQVGKVYCGQCDKLLMYPFGAPAVKCSNCLFVTEIGASELPLVT